MTTSAGDTITISRAEYDALLQFKTDATATYATSEFDTIFAKLAAAMEYPPARVAVEAMSAQMNADYVTAVRSSVESSAFQNAHESVLHIFQSHPIAQHWCALSKGCGELFASLAIQAVWVNELKDTQATDFERRLYLAENIDKATSLVRADIEQMRDFVAQLLADFPLLEAFVAKFDTTMKHEMRILRAKENSVKQADVSIMSVFMFSNPDHDEDDFDEYDTALTAVLDSPVQLPAAKRTKSDVVIEPKPVIAADLAASKPGPLLFPASKPDEIPSPMKLLETPEVVAPKTTAPIVAVPMASKAIAMPIAAEPKDTKATVMDAFKGISILDTAFKDKGITCIVVSDVRTAVAMYLYAPHLKKTGLPPKGAITVQGTKVVYQSPGGTRFSVFLKGEVPDFMRSKLRALNMENWVFDIKSDPVLAAFAQAHRDEIDTEKDIGRS